MQSIIQVTLLELNNKNLLDEWKKMSDGISESLQGVSGFIYRDSGVGEDGKIYCILKWESIEKHDAFDEILQASDKFKTAMVKFTEIVNMETMKSKVLKVI